MRVIMAVAEPCYWEASSNERAHFDTFDDVIFPKSSQKAPVQNPDYDSIRDMIGIQRLDVIDQLSGQLVGAIVLDHHHAEAPVYGHRNFDVGIQEKCGSDREKGEEKQEKRLKEEVSEDGMVYDPAAETATVSKNAKDKNRHATLQAQTNISHIDYQKVKTHIDIKTLVGEVIKNSIAFINNCTSNDETEQRNEWINVLPPVE